MTNIIKDYKRSLKQIGNYYHYLTKLTLDEKNIGIVNEWIVDNYVTLLELNNIVNASLNEGRYRDIIKYSSIINDVIEGVFSCYNYKLNKNDFLKAFVDYQEEHNCYFSYALLCVIKPVFIMNVVNKINDLCIKAKFNIDNRVLIRNLAMDINDFINDKEYLASFVVSDDILNNPFCLSYLNDELNNIGSKADIIFHSINSSLEKCGKNLKSELNKAYQENIFDNILIADLFGVLQFINTLETEDFYKEVSLAEKELSRDKVYFLMDSNTKNQYRLALVKLSKKMGEDENKVARELVNNSIKQGSHVGFYLIKDINTKVRSIIYVGVIVLCTIFLSLILTRYLNGSILSFFVLLIPNSELVMQVTNSILIKIFHPKAMLSLDYSKGISKDSATMVVVPTIIKNINKIDEVYHNLEMYYLANKSDHLYFTLLGDCSEEMVKVVNKDREMTEYGLKVCDALNKKYGKDIFFFVYRKRVFHKSENSYLGWERKRGALIHFNRLLMGMLTDDDKFNYFNACNLELLKDKIKYVITLDADTKLIVDSVFKLVGVMAHPLNKPVLNKYENKVVSGYGILQPKVSVDVISSNKSVYAQLFGGLGGFDIYNNLVSNVYQDVFGEGIFMGKGIYDLEVFEKVIDYRFPNGLVLSHDLLESSYLRAGYVSNIEIIDDFCSSFLTDMTRQHRWARGDVQITPWLFSYVKDEDGRKYKNPINLLSKWKIFDNIRRNLIDVCLLLIFMIAYLSNNSNPEWWILYIFIVIAFPIILYVIDKLKTQFRVKVKVKPYHKVFEGGKAVVFRACITFMMMPYKAKLYLDAGFRSLYRMFISKKGLLKWVTAEDAAKVTKNTLNSYVLSFSINYIVSIIMLIIVYLYYPKHFFSMVVISLVFAIAPFVAYLISKEIKFEKQSLGKAEKKQLKSLGSRTWQFFEDQLISEYNYLIPDNYQDNRSYKSDFKTSSTNIGFSLVSIVSAYLLDFINYDKAYYLLNRVIDTVEKLDKWEGHLYNWYNIKSLDVMTPRVVSSVDSGNFVACLIVVKEFLIKQNNMELAERVKKLIDDTDFSKLYTKNDVFSICYNEEDDELSEYEYNCFASETRLLSYVAISKGDVLPKHWFCLDKTLTKFGNYKGLISWSGSLFEYYMPLIFMKSYPNTLLDESYSFAYLCQKSYMERVDSHLPWGISECAYDEFDDGVNYKYKTFSVPYLKLKQDVVNHIVISPYSSIMVLMQRPGDAYDNFIKLKKMNLYSKYGLYESFDTKTQRVVRSYFAHHQGMILASITNCLMDNVIQNLFMSDIRNEAFDILIKEKMQIDPVLDLKIAKYKNFNYKKEKIENDVRFFTSPQELPEVSIVSNSKYTVLMNDRGNGFSRYKDIQLNRYRKVTENDYGTFLYIKDLKTKKVWSNTYAPINVKPSRYEVIFASDKIKYVLVNNDITVITEVVVSEKYQAEIRKITFKNSSNSDRELELTTYLEPILTENVNDVVHRSFSSLFLEGRYDKDLDSLIVHRNVRDSLNNYYLLHRLYVEKSKGGTEYEFRRDKFIGRGYSSSNPISLKGALSSQDCVAIDPVMSMRKRIKIKAHSKAYAYIMNAYGKSYEQVVEASLYYDNPGRYDDSLKVATVANINNTKKLNVSGEDMRLYNVMLNYLYQTSKININEERSKLLSMNKLSQENLWKFSVSGDRPIITVTINQIGDISLADQVLKAFEYFKSKGIYVDVVIISKLLKGDFEMFKKHVNSLIYHMNKIHGFRHRAGNIYVLDKCSMNDDEEILFNTVARLRIDSCNNKSLREFIDKLQSENTLSNYKNFAFQEVKKCSYDTSGLMFYNGYGGFEEDGSKYVITTPCTPSPWMNIMANKKIGTLVSNNGTGFTYAYSSQDYKITSWNCEGVMHDQSEGIQINGERVVPSVTKHGFGYTEFYSQTNDLDECITQFVSVEDTVKFYLVSLKNNTKDVLKLDVGFWINPVLGGQEEKTSRYILCNFDKEHNNLNMRNVYNKYYSNVNVFLSSTDKINDYTMKKLLVKAISVNIKIKPGDVYELAFMLGSADNYEDTLKLQNKYSVLENVKKELLSVKEKWSNVLSLCKVKTEDESFNYMVNGWYLYQTIVGRLLARAGFYQVSGAFGYRDQLQDAVNICLIYPDITRNQIINNAMHQFKEGDVLHWWIDKQMFGLRSRYKDDYLWMIYAVSKYLERTMDMSILDEMVPFVSADLLSDKESERGVNYSYTEDTKSVYEHLKLAIDRAVNDLGCHGLPKMGGGDWNDGMNKIGINGVGESVWLGFFLYDNLRRFVDISLKYDKNFDDSYYNNVLDKLKRSLNTNGFDKNYYLRAYYDDGTKVGSSESDECQIDLISQCFAILTDVISEDEKEEVLEQVRLHLVDPKLKIVKLLTPAFSKSKHYPGYIKDYPEGIRENGGQYTHAVAWYILALLKAGHIDEAYEVYQNINPINRALDLKSANTYKVEPYVIVGDIYSNSSNKGRGGWTWYTGSSGWFYRVAINDILGLNIYGDKLVINPSFKMKWNKVEITYKYIDTIYHIVIDRNKEGILLDGSKVYEVKLINDLKNHEVIWGIK